MKTPLPSTQQQTHEQRLEYLNDSIDSGELFRVQHMLDELEPGEIAHLIEASLPNQRQFIWELIDQKEEGEVLIGLSDDVRASLIEDMETRELVAAVKGLDIDDLADFLQSLPDDAIRDTLRGMGRQTRDKVEAVLAYPEDSAGGMMDTQIIKLRADVSVDVVLRYLRKQKALPDNLDNLFVVNSIGHFLGLLSISTLLTSQPDEELGDIIDRDYTPIYATTPSNEVALTFENRDLVSAPVVDEETNMLLGRITIDDVVDVIRDEAEHAVMSMSGLHEEEDLFAPVWNSAKRRAVWLGTNLVTALMAAWVVGQFEETIAMALPLAVLMGVIPSMGGIAGSQTLTLMIRGMALGYVSSANVRTLFFKELMVGLINGVVWAVIIFAVATIAYDEPSIGIIVGIAMILNLVTAPTVGVLMPLLLKKLNIDPALAGSVILTTVTDIVGYAGVLGLATLVLIQLKDFFA